MHRLTDFTHHIIGDVHDVVDRIISHQMQSAPHPCRGLSDFDIIDIMCDIAGAEFRRLHGDVKSLVFDICLRIIQCRHLERLAEGRCNFPRDAEDTHRVRPVSRDGDIVDPVIEADDRLDIFPGRYIIRKNKQAVVAGSRIHILGKTELGSGAEHPIRIVSAQLSLPDRGGSKNSHMILRCLDHLGADQCQRVFLSGADIVCAAAHLKRAIFSGTDPAQMQMGVRNRIALLDISDDNAMNILPELRQLLHLKPAVKQLLFQFLRCHININIFLQPAKWC